MMESKMRPKNQLDLSTQNQAFNHFEAQEIDPEDNKVDLVYYWRVIAQFKWRILLVATLVTVLVTLVLFSMTPVYQSTGTLLVEGKQNTLLSIEEMYAMDTSRTEYFQTQFEILKSRDLARRVINKMKLAESPEFKKKDTEDKKPFWKEWLADIPGLNKPEVDDAQKKTEAQEEGLLEVFGKRLTVKPRPKTQLVDVSFEATDPTLAKDIVNALGEAYIDNGLEARMDNTRKAAEWLSSRLQSLKDRLATSENKLQDYLSKEHLVDLEGVMTLTSKEIEKNSDRLANARQARLEAESTYNKISSGVSSAELVPEIIGDKGVQDLKSKEAELSGKVSELSQHYGPDHPTLVAAKSELANIRVLLKKQISSIASGIKNRYEIAKTNEESVLASIETNKGQIQDIGRKQTRLRELQREVESNQRIYETFFNRFKEANEAAEIGSSNIRFVDKASQPIAPIKPNKKLLIPLTFVAMLFFGILIAIYLDYLDATIKSPEDIDKKLDRPFLGAVPFIADMKDKEGLVGTYLSNNPRSSFAESIRTIRTGLVLSALDSDHHIWMVTSSFPGEGKTTTSMNLAESLAQLDEENRVLLIEVDLRRPTFKKRFNLPARSLGLTHLLAMNAKLEECVYPANNTRLDILPAGMPPPNPLELLASRAFVTLLDDLEKRYKYIILDAPPVNAVSDAQLLAQHVRSVIYAVKSDSTPVKDIMSGLRTLERFGAPLAGVVLTQLDVEKINRYGTGKYSGYYYYQSAYATDQDDAQS